jgi:hypothetical protein
MRCPSWWGKRMSRDPHITPGHAAAVIAMQVLAVALLVLIDLRT